MAGPAVLTAQQIKKKLEELNNLVHEVERIRIRSENDLKKLKEAKSGGPGPELKSALLDVRSGAFQEESLLRTALDKIGQIRKIRNRRQLEARCAGNKEAIRRGTLITNLVLTAQTLPLYVGKTAESKPPPLCGATPAASSHVAEFGDMVAAYVKVTDEKNWILAEIISYEGSTNTYEIEDVDEEDKQRYKVKYRQVVPLPLMRANPETDPQALFPEGEIVMALYPQTTCFYKAVVNSLPTTANDEYEVLFEDSSCPEGFSPPVKVHQRYMFTVKDKRKRTRVG